MIELFGTISMVLAVTGVVLNNRKMIICFWFWMISNAMSGWIHFDSGVYSLMVRDAVFFVLAIEGLIRWGKDKKFKI